MTLTDTGNELSEILSGEAVTPTAAPVADATITPPADTGVQRDEQGRFAAKAEEPAPVEQQPAQPAAIVEEQPGAMVPQQALHASRQENAELKRQIAELNAKFDGFSRALPQVAAPQQEKPKPKDFWEDPDGFTDERTRAAIAPVVERFQGMIFNNSLQKVQSEPGGPEKIAAAEAAMRSALQQKDPEATAAYQRLQAGYDPVGDLVRWHGKAQALARVGSDPDAFVKSELDKLLADPAKAAEILQRIQAGVTAQPANRSAPAIQLPPSITKLSGGANEASAGLGDDSARFAAALAR